MRTIFQIGPCCFEIDSDVDVVWESDFQKFIVSQEAIPSDVFVLQGVLELPKIKGELIIRRPDLEVYIDEDVEYRYHRVGGLPWYFAMRRENQVYYRKPCADWLNSNRLLFSLLGLEKLILNSGCLLLHSSFIKFEGMSILFTGPSGIGKSTQADLWSTYRNACIVNGDRALICQTKTGWEAYGWPFSGSSTFCENAHGPVKAIVYLEKYKDNSIRKCYDAEAMKLLISEVTINRWNGSSFNEAVDYIEQLIREVPVYYLQCTKSEEAVSCLEEIICEREDILDEKK